MAGTVRAAWLDRPGPWFNRAVYSWVLTFPLDPAVDRLHTAYQPLIRSLPGLTPVPRQWFHVVIQAVGYTHRISQDELDPLVEATRTRLRDVPAFPVRFEAARVGPISLRLPLRPMQPLRHLRVHLRTAIASTWGSESLPHLPDLDPSLAIGYWTRTLAAGPLRTQVAAADSLPAVSTQVSAVSLVNLVPAHHQCEWIPYARLQLHH